MSLKPHSVSRSRGMPTLSLKAKPRTELRSGAWGSVGLFLFFVLLNPYSEALAQDTAKRSKRVNMETIIIADENLPEAVLEAQSKKLLVSVVFIHKNNPALSEKATGTGTIIAPGIILTNHHVLSQGIQLIIKAGRKEEDYRISFFGTIFGEEEINFPLFFVPNKEKSEGLRDFMILRVGNDILTKALAISLPNPYRILASSPILEENLRIGETIYITGLAPSIGELLDEKGSATPVWVETIDYTFKSEISREVPMSPETKIKKFYRVRGAPEFGFSGGMALNKQGHIVGIIFAMSHSRNFSFLLSSKDIKDFLKDGGIKIN